MMLTRPYCLAVLVLISILLQALTGAGACPLDLPTMILNIDGNNLVMEIAATPESRRCGLSLRDELPREQGMLFIYPEELPLSFWMKDTRIPLSIAFINQEGSIISIQDMKPQQTAERYRAPSPAKYAIEVKQGWFSRHNIGVGDFIDLAPMKSLSAN